MRPRQSWPLPVALPATVSHPPPARCPGPDNTAYDTKIRELSGENQNEKLFGDWFSYWKTPRAQIFARDAPKVKE